ncbi:unnamed protein product [Vitrella brassicaformis CCMP3155]|uniref:RING-CH-type domain-containing protein n=1 Tax=Vitrella brassicaformis (strain CCMP3155) TaxID=1169540 RepID=A0A0G4FZ21_VITBC|nr:unnamed protein product [Vitrella brassicaformis CCMP3155]|eukprot:CEM20636.1 unnamed protein product [Vitrella brassicaformis CCMP3155]
MEGASCFICLGGPDEGKLEKPCRCRTSHRSCLDTWRKQSKDPTRCEICQSVYLTVASLTVALPSVSEVLRFMVFRLAYPIICVLLLLYIPVPEQPVATELSCIDAVKICNDLMHHPNPAVHSPWAKICLPFNYDAYHARYEKGTAHGIKEVIRGRALVPPRRLRGVLMDLAVKWALPEFVILFASLWLFKALAEVAPQLPNPIWHIMTIRRLFHGVPHMQCYLYWHHAARLGISGISLFLLLTAIRIALDLAMTEMGVQ